MLFTIKRRRLHTHAPSVVRHSLDRWDALLFLAIATVFSLFAISAARTSSATFDEVAHLPAGYSYLTLDDFRLNPEHPPLIKSLAAWPLLRADVWPAAPRLKPDAGAARDDREALQRLRQAWSRAPNDFAAEWTFGQTLLFGTRDVARVHRGLDASTPLPTSSAFSGDDFVNDAAHLLFLGRLPNVAVALLLLALLYAWGTELGGRTGAVTATALGACDPNLIAHSAVVTTDIGITTFLFGAMYATWRTIHQPTGTRVLLIGLFTGLAAISKFSAVLLAPILLVVALTWIAIRESAIPRRHRIALAILTAIVCLITSYLMIWAAYGFRFASTNGAVAADMVAARSRFHAVLIAGAMNRQVRTSAEVTTGKGYQRTTSAPAQPDLTARTLVRLYDLRALPQAFLEGIAYARATSIGRLSYFRGALTTQGSTQFFPVSLLTKTPDVTLLLVILSAFVALWWRRLSLVEWAIIGTPPLMIVGTAIASPLNLGYRHVLPAVPFLWIATALLAGPLAYLQPRVRAGLIAIGMIGIIVSSQFVRASDGSIAATSPHPLSYFNWSSGGPDRGHRLFVDSNLDWGQSLPSLRAWLTEHRVTRPIHLCYFGTADPRAYGIRFHSLPGCHDGRRFPTYSWMASSEGRTLRTAQLTEGDIVAVSATFLVGLYRSELEHKRLTTFLADRTRPIGLAGRAIHLFEVTDAAP